jgi:large subunit ribosomal protein L35
VPKMKTHSGAKKRFKKRSSGKIARKKATAGHNLIKKTSKRKSDLHLAAQVHASDVGRVNRMLSA